MYKTIIKNTSVILIVITIIIAVTIIFKPEPTEPKEFARKRAYEEGLISLMNTKSIGVYAKGMTVTKQATGETREYKGIINNITDYEEVEYFINLIKDCPLITQEYASLLMPTQESLYMYDENNNQLLIVEIDNYDHTIDIQKDNITYYLENKHLDEINEFLKKYINYEF